MAYQSRQPCRPPPLNVAQNPTEASTLHQSTQPCLPPPSCIQPCLMETPNAGAPAWTTFCNTASPESCAAPSAETSSAAGDPPTLSSYRPLPANVEPAETYAQPCVTLCASPDGSAVASSGAGASYVLPGSIVSLDPHGGVTVKPGPSEEGGTGNETDSIFVGSYTPHRL